MSLLLSIFGNGNEKVRTLNVFHPYLSGVHIAISSISLALLNHFESRIKSSFLHLLMTSGDVTLLQPKDPPYLAQESRMWMSPRTSRIPFTYMAPPKFHPLSWLRQPAKRSTASGSTKAVLRRVTQAYFRGHTETTESSPWKWTVFSKARPSSK